MSHKVLVSYATKMGATAAIAATIGGQLRRAGHDVEVHEVSDVKAVSEYDAVVFGSAIYDGQWRPEAVRFLRTHVRELRRRKVWLFHSGPIGPASDFPEQVPADVAKLAAEIGAPAVRTFAGELQPDAVVGRSARRAGLEDLVGDDRDWDEIRAWADEIANTV